MEPLSTYRVMVYNVEDDANEQRRRLSAILTKTGRTPADIAGKIARVGPSNVGTLIERDEDGLLLATAAMEELERRIAAFKPDVLILDPLAELHTSEENDNTALRAVVARFRALAAKYDLALVLLHHTARASWNRAMQIRARRLQHPQCGPRGADVVGA
jgi:RecA-family ATPase